MITVDIQTQDPCHTCRFSHLRQDRYMFQRPYVCSNKTRIDDVVNRCKILIDADRLREACYLLDKAATMKQMYDEKGFIEPDESIFTPYCFEKNK